jgi:hypothetical protein
MLKFTLRTDCKKFCFTQSSTKKHVGESNTFGKDNKRDFVFTTDCLNDKECQNDI